MPQVLEPYRVLFPLGIFYAVTAALVWPLHSLGWIGYPAVLHWTLMIQGFFHCFVLGFLLTALPSFLHADRTRLWETLAVFGAMMLFGACAFLGRPAAAQWFYLATFAVLIQAAARRFPRRRGDPPEEFVFVAVGVILGILGGVLGLGAAAGWWAEPAPRFPLHVLSRGMALSVVLGVGGLLVPTFSAMREPLVIPGIARPGERRPRRILYAPLVLLFIVALGLEWAALPVAAGWARAAAGTVLALLVWKVVRLPGRRTVLSWTIWSAGWLLLAGLWLAAIAPERAVAAFHLVFLGGFGLLIVGIATRVVVTHGGYGPAREPRVLRIETPALVLASLAVRVAADFVFTAGSPAALRLYGWSGVLWILGFGLWALRAAPCIVRRVGAPIIPADHPQRILLQKR